MADAAAEVAALEIDDPALVRLARMASVASVVEPSLLRSLRLRVPGLSDLTAGVEADLWFSPMAHVATSSQLTLRRDVLEVLREQLARDEHRVGREAARRLVEEAHGSHSDMIRLEERIIWAVVTRDEDAVGAAWGRAGATVLLGDERAAEVVRWFLQARRRLPAEALLHPSAQRLATASSLYLDRVVPPDLLAADRFPEALGDLAPMVLPQSTVGVRLTQDGIRFVHRDEGPPVITLPDTRPHAVEVSWRDADLTERSAVVVADVGSQSQLEGLGTGVALRLLDGRRFSVRLAQGSRVNIAVFGSLRGLTDRPPEEVSARVAEAVADPDLRVELIHNPRDLAARPDLVLVGPFAQRWREGLFEVVRQLTRAAVRARTIHRDADSPLGTVVFLSRDARSELLEPLQRELGDAMSTVEYAPDPPPDPILTIAEWAHRVARGSARLYELDVETARRMLNAVALAFHMRTFHAGVGEAEERRIFLLGGLRPVEAPETSGAVSFGQPDLPTVIFNHVRMVCEWVFDQPVTDYLAGGPDPSAGASTEYDLGWSPYGLGWPDFSAYLSFVVDRLLEYCDQLRDALGAGLVKVGFAVPAGTLEAARLAVGERLLPHDLDEPMRTSQGDDGRLFGVDRLNVASLVSVLTGPLLRAVEKEAERRREGTAAGLRVPPFTVAHDVLELTSEGDEWSLRHSVEGVLVHVRHWQDRDTGRLDRILEKVAHELPDSGDARSIGSQLGKVLGAEALASLAETSVDSPGGRRSLRIRTNVPNLPWELTRVEGFDSRLPPYLGCQFALTSQLPTSDPPREAGTSGTFAAVAPAYSGTDRPPLRGAVAEVDELLVELNGARLPSTRQDLLAELQGRDDLAVVHLAGHYFRSPSDSAFVLDDGRLDANTVSSLTLRSAPLVFLSGPTSPALAVAFLTAGASCVVAPTWMVNDDESRAIARRFYAGLTSGVQPDEVLRRIRCEYEDPDVGVAALGYRLMLGGLTPPVVP